MTIIEAITAADSLKANLIPQELKIAWLSTLDRRFKAEVIDTHEGADEQVAIEEYINGNVEAYEKAVEEYAKINEVTIEEARENVEFHEISYKEAKEHIRTTRNDIFFNGYDGYTPLNVELLIKAPYDAVYVSWLEAKIDYTHNDYQRYANTSEVFDNDYRAAINAYNRAHRSKRIKVKYF